VHCGLFGHVDSGKTAIASVLSSFVSTAGLDAHPQAKKRGISIDLGFTSFDIDNYRITLVDAPGHADLIRSVVASACIIDVAILVIDALEGPKIQTGEHMIILSSFGIDKIVVALNKIDLLDGEKAIKSATLKIRRFLEMSGVHFKDLPVVPVSAKEELGFNELVAKLKEILENSDFSRDNGGPFIMPLDHHFLKKGFGTVLTGTILSGRVRVGDVVEINPVGMRGKVKSIRIFKADYHEAFAGDRIGLAMTGLTNSKLYRGCIACKPGSIQNSKHLLVEGSMVVFFKHRLGFSSQIHATVGMLTSPAIFFPFKREGGINYRVESLGNDVNSSNHFEAYVYMRNPVPCLSGFSLLVTRLDLPPNELRIAAKCVIKEIIDGPPDFFKIKEKYGMIKDENKSIVERLATSIEGARKIVGRNVIAVPPEREAGERVPGVITEPFGTKGNVRVKFKGNTPIKGSIVILKYPKQIRLGIFNGKKEKNK